MRDIPSIDRLLQRPRIQALIDEYGRTAVVGALRSAADDLRRLMSTGQPQPSDVGAVLEEAAPALLRSSFSSSLRPVINATGVILHTNLGRAPLASAAIARVAALAAYSNLEFDL